MVSMSLLSCSHLVRADVPLDPTWRTGRPSALGMAIEIVDLAINSMVI